MTTASSNLTARICGLLKVHVAVLCPDCDKKLAEMLVGQAIFWCRKCKEYKMLDRST